MTKKAVPIEYGYYILPEALRPGREAQLRLFPFSWRIVRGTIITEESRSTHEEWYCPICEERRMAWIDAHPRDPWALTQKASNQAVQPPRG